jgi:hypothetical protein
MEFEFATNGHSARAYFAVRFFGRLTKRGAGICACAAILSMLVGCNRSSQESQVSGCVKLDGSQIGPGTVVFAPADGGKPAIGSIEADGSYTLNTSREPGLAAGKYKVAVSIRELPKNVKRSDQPPPGKLRIPGKYELSTSSGLEFEVAPGRNTIDIDLKNS